ncbi:hypothetical protein ZWY2020_027173, partial [Hordeum vulgare]
SPTEARFGEQAEFQRRLSDILLGMAAGLKRDPIMILRVMEKIIVPALQELPADQLDQPASQEVFFEEFKKYLGTIARRLQECPIIVAHTENTCDGAGIRKILSNKFEFDKEHKDRTSKKYLRVAFDKMDASVNLPPYGAVNQVDAVVNEAFKMANADDGKAVDEAEFL